jgi:hypothetical protein
MKSYRLSELRDVIRSTPFTEWWSGFLRSEAEIADKSRRADELSNETAVMELQAELLHRAAADMLSRADDLGDEAARMATQAQEIENRSLDIVAGYEELRFKVSDVWYRLGATERKLEEGRDALAAASAASPATAKSGARELKQKQSHAEAIVKQAERQRSALQEEYERETRRKSQLWEEVEGLWARTFEIALLMSERRVDARRVRRDSERLFREAEEKKKQANRCRLEGESAAADRDTALERRRGLMAQARETLGCVVGERFLYWRRKEDDKSAYAVSLFADADTYNIEVRPLAICSVSRQRGAGFLEPAREEWAAPTAEGDRRFEEFFLGSRKGRAVSLDTSGKAAS